MIMNRERALLQNTVVIFWGSFLPKLTTFITLPILTIHLTKEEFGSYDLLNTLISLALPIITLKIEAAAFRFLIDVRKNVSEVKKIITSIYVFLIPISLISSVCLNLILFHAIKMDISLIVVLYFFIDTILSVTQQISRGLSYNLWYSISSIVNAIINMSLILVLILDMKAGLDGLLVSLIISKAVSLSLLFFLIKLHRFIDIRYFSFSCLKRLLDYSWPMIPNSFSSWVMSLSDRLVITIFLGVEANAVYAVANKIPNLFTIIQGTFISAWQENASMTVADKDANDYYSRIFDLVFSVFCGIMAILISSSPFLFAILIRGDYLKAYYQMPILFGGMFFSALSSFLGSIYIAHKETKNVGVTTIFSAIINLGIDFILIDRIGIYAGSISTLLSYLCLAIYRMYDLDKSHKIFFDIQKSLFMVAILIFMAIICFLNIPFLNIINVLIAVIFWGVINKKILCQLLLHCKVLEKFKK